MRLDDFLEEVGALRARIRAVRSLLASCFAICALGAPVISVAQDKPAASGYEHYAPEFAKNFPKKDKTVCDCQGKLDKLNSAIDDLNKFDKDHPNYRAVAKASADVKTAEKAVEEPDEKGKKPTGKKKTQLEQAVTTAKAAETAAKKKMKDGPPADKADPYQLQIQLADILSRIETWSKALDACEKACKDKPKPPEGGGKGDDGPKEGGGGGGGDKKKPCFKTQKELDDAIEKAIAKQEHARKNLAAFTKTDKEGHMIPPDQDAPEFIKAQQAFQEASDELYELRHSKPCPPGPGGMYIPGTPGLKEGQYFASTIPGGGTPGETISYSVPFATDGGAYCTFGEGTGVGGTVVTTGDDGTSTPPTSSGGTDQGGTPPTPGRVVQRDPQDPPKTPDPAPTPVASPSPTPVSNPTPTEPPKRPETPTPTPTPRETPKTTDTPTPTPTPTETPKKPDDPPAGKTTDTDVPKTPGDPPVTIYIKASEAVLEGGQPGEPIQNQVIKLVMQEKPALPTTPETRRAEDKGFDKPAPQCTTGADGQCKVNVPQEDRALYAMEPRGGGAPANSFRLEVNVMKHTGGVADVTGKQVPDLTDALTNGNVTSDIVRIGDRTYLRLGFNVPASVAENLLEKFSKLLNVSVETDTCLFKEPGPPLGSEPLSYSAINRELPASIVKLPPAKRVKR